MWRGWQLCDLRRTATSSAAVTALSYSHRSRSSSITCSILPPPSSLCTRLTTTTVATPTTWRAKRRGGLCVSSARHTALRCLSAQAACHRTQDEGCAEIYKDNDATSLAREKCDDDDNDAGEEEDEEMDALDAYEAMLLNAQAGPEDTTNNTGTSNHADNSSQAKSSTVAIPAEEGEAESGTHGESVLAHVERWSREITALLPADGTPVRLTEITPLVNAEAMCEAYGSVLAFLQRLPSRFVCTCATEERAAQGAEELRAGRHTSGKLKRWYVARVAAPHDAIASAAHDVQDVKNVLTGTSVQDWCMQETWREEQQQHTTRHSVPRARDRSGEASVLRASAAAQEEYKKASQHEEEEEDDTNASKTLHVGSRASTATGAAVQEERVSRRLVRVLSAPANQPTRTMNPLPLSVDEGFSNAVWNVELELEEPAELPSLANEYTEEEDEEETKDTRPSNALDARNALREAMTAQNVSQQLVRYDGLGGEEAAAQEAFGRAPRRTRPNEPTQTHAQAAARQTPLIAELDWAALARAPVVAAPTRTAPRARPPRTQSHAKTPQVVRKPPLTPEALLAEHTRIARAKGWRSPQEMLDLFVECVPTFYVPLRALRQTDLLAKTLGPRNRMAAVVRIYSYFFDYDTASATVRLKPRLTHAQLGSANAYYRQYAQVGEHEVAAREATAAQDKPETRTHTQGTSRAREEETYNETADARTHKAHALQTSATTRTFPVLQPLLVSKVKLAALPRRRTASASAVPHEVAEPHASRTDTGNDASSVAMSRHTSHPATKVERGGPSSLPCTDKQGQHITPSDPFAAADPAEWPVLAQLACALPSHQFLPLRQAAARANVSLDALQQLLAPSAAAHALYAPFLCSTDCYEEKASRADSHHYLQGTGKPRIRQIRLRPYWLAPHSMGELTAEHLPQPLVRQLRPAWVSLQKMWNKLDEAARQTLSTDARHQEPAHCTSNDCNLTEIHETNETHKSELSLIASYLRCFGACCWVNEAGDKIRRYTADAELDDMTHLLVLLLRRCLTNEYLSLPDVVAEAHRLSKHCVESHGKTYDASFGLVGQLHTYGPEQHALEGILRRHPKLFELQHDTKQGVSVVRRRTVYGKQ